MPKQKEMHYPEVNPNPDFPQIEESILALWAQKGLFKKSVASRPAYKGAHSNEFIFYDGPPFANGLPHYGHLLTGYVKDLFARYQTMKGKRVERRFGWDCHGLPAEMGAEKDLGISGRQAILKYGMEKFNEYCRTSVMKYTQEWQDYVTRQARWVDFENDYKTMDQTFMESVLWAFKQLYDKGLIYEAYRVMPYSWAAETPLSNFETRLDNSYREREDKAITVAFELNTPPKGAPAAGKYYILAWTTTPWTLPSNLALAVNKDVEYVCVCHSREGGNPDQATCYILSKNALGRYAKEFNLDSDVLKNMDSRLRGNDMVGLSYTPLFPYFKDHSSRAFKIIDGSDFVTDADGTGVVHIAPGFGEDDQRVAEKNGITVVCPVDHAGRFTDEIYDLPYPRHPREGGDLEPQSKTLEIPAQGGDDVLRLRGLNVVAEPGGSKFGLANDRIIDYLKKTGQLIKQETIKHNYPHCWRTDQPLIYRAVPSWYVEVTKFKDRMVELNQQINWVPGHVKDGLFGKWLEGARDWSISRNRFWGTPIPVWRSNNPENKVLYVFGSIKELEEFFETKVTELHRPAIDNLTKPDPLNDNYTISRVEDVFDCWFESGSMPYGQVHYPFENKDWFEQHFPADFIVEYQAQTRGWFYTLMVLGTALFDKPPFKNCICHGVVLDDKGQKLSKRLNNYADPRDLFKQYGADALRWFMMSSPVMRGSEMYIDKEGKFIRDTVRLYIKPVWNAYNFFCLYAAADGVKAKLLFTKQGDFKTWHPPEHPMDRYILSKLSGAVRTIAQSLDSYDTPGACEAVSAFFEALNNWYIRRSKPRFWKGELDNDKQDAYNTLYTVLHVMARAAAPLLPLAMEEIYRGLTGEESVHLADFPNTEAIGVIFDPHIMQDMDRVRDICNAALSVRNARNLRVRLPLASLTVIAKEYPFPDEFSDIIRDEVNVKEVRADRAFESMVDLKLQVNFPKIGARLGQKTKEVIPAIKSGKWQQLKDGSVEVAGVTLQPDEYTLLLEAKPEIKDSAAPLSTNDALVVLDTNVTQELESEGIARDLVRMIQQARKDAGLNVSDRISLYLDSSAQVVKAIAAHKDYVMEQTLAVEVLDKKPKKEDYSAENMIDDQKVIISLSKAA
jgi:isoleucyl-tRNA synthetase